MRYCSRCKAHREDSEVNKGQGWCKECQRQYRQENKKHCRELGRNWQENNREKQRESNRKCQAKHRVENKAQSRIYYQEHKVERNEYNKAWHRANPELLRAYDNRRRARLCSIPARLTAAEWLEVFNHHGGKCIYCGDTTLIEMDHLTPLVRGGTHTKDNVAPACRGCNRAKGAMTKDEFEAFRLQYLVSPPTPTLDAQS